MDATLLTAPPRRVALLDRTFDLCFRRPLPLLALSAVYAAVAFPMQAWVDETAGFSGAALLRQLAFALATNLVYGIATYAATRLVHGELRAEPPRFAAMLADTGAALPRVAGVVLLALLLGFLRLLLFIVPGLIFAVAAVFSVNAAAGAGLGGAAAISRSRALVRGRWWRTLGWVFLFNLPLALLAVLFQYLPRESGMVALQAAVATLLTPLALVGPALLYFDREEHRDHVEREKARRVLEAPPVAAPTAAYASPAHAAFDPGAFSAFEHRGWQSAAGAYQRALAKLTVQAADSLLDAAGVEGGTRLLDVASGPGDLAMQAAARGAQVTGADFAPEMLAIARANHPGIEFRVADAEALPFPDRSFDAVTMSFLLGHLAHPDRALAEARRVLCPGGKFATAWWQGSDRAVGFGIVLDAVRAHGRMQVDLPEGPPFEQFADPDALAGALAAAGFGDVQLRPEPMTWRAASGEEVFEAYLHGTVRTAGLLREQSPEALLAIRAEMVRRVEALRGEDGIAMPMPCWIAWGVRVG